MTRTSGDIINPMIDTTLPPPTWVDTEPLFKSMIADLSAQPRLAVDTESNSLHAYRERVCLIQFSTPQRDFIVDPLAVTDLTALGSLFINPHIEKVFHAVEYDLICLRRDYGFSFASLFDTMQAARILGYLAVGLDRLLKEKFGILMDKRYQKADWAARPLADEQIHYARLDTHYLFQLRDQFEAELREKGRWELALEDFRRAADVDPGRERTSAEARERFIGRRDLSPREMTIAGELAVLREGMAEKMDRPPFKVLDDDSLIAVARAAPDTTDGLLEAGLSPRQIQMWGSELLAAVVRGSEAPLLRRRAVQRPSDATLARVEKLKAWRKQVAQELAVESDIVLPKSYMHALAEQPPTNSSDLAAVLSTTPWRYEKFGVQILKLLES